MSADFRETVLTLMKVRHVVRTERGNGTVAQLDKAHTKAVKAYLEDDYRRVADAAHAERMAYLKAADYPDPEGWGDNGKGLGEHRRARDIAHEEKQHAKLPKPGRRYRFPACNWDAASRPLRALPTTDPLTYLTEVGPGHYATAEAAEGLADQGTSSPDQ
ncbi:hypothetical protein OHB41_03695 [Streptomyces sp. NBC_01571]|uniref:hypothetical protein n=1 Tax=Streptomyces sp. NBC_01571 TaxID=2975883 RepID=UPI00225BAF61|nr:hypothetical protein [Streptomyces sp. NBC_01571]MCX4572302.1 hypothetical protein [Streptomyces sp. NBC_01571]